jgi:hypothetical protein
MSRIAVCCVADQPSKEPTFYRLANVCRVEEIESSRRSNRSEECRVKHAERHGSTSTGNHKVLNLSYTIRASPNAIGCKSLNDNNARSGP